jgi:YidC/Oxa1 family membrane protein insertase
MDRNSVIGLVIIAAILILWGVFTSPSEEEIAEQRRLDSLNRVEQVERQVKQQAIQQESSSLTNQQNQNQVAPEISLTEEIEFYTYETDLLIATFTSKGGKLYSIELKDYLTHEKKPLKLFYGDSNSFGFNFFYDNKPIQTNNLVFENISRSDSFQVISQNETVSFRHTFGSDKYIQYDYIIEPDNYMVQFDVQFMGMNNDMTLFQERWVNLYWDAYLPEHEKGRKTELQYSSLYYKHSNEHVEMLKGMSKKPLLEEPLDTEVDWIAYKGQFFASVLIPEDPFLNGDLEMQSFEEGKNIRRMTSNMGVELNLLPQEVIKFNFYFGPNKFKELKQYEELELHSLVSVGGGFIRWINRLIIIPLFDFLSKYSGNYGVIIALLTLIIKVGLFPLTYRSYLSQARMRVLKPQIDEINEKHGDNAMEKQKATMALYKKVGISPMGGCLPMILQMPILFAMFRFFPTSIELRQESFLWAHDLSTYDAIIEWGTKIPLLGNHLSLFTILMTVTTILQMKTSGQAATTSQMPGMKNMMYIMPVMFLFVLNSFPAGLTYYYFLANVITLGQNFIFKQMINEEEILKKLEARKAKPQKKSNFQKRMEEAAKQRGYQAPKRK